MENPHPEITGIEGATYAINPSKPCPFGKGTIDSCGNMAEGAMFPYCAFASLSEGTNRCPQVIVHFVVKSANEAKK